MSIEHKSLKDEILHIIRRSTLPLDSGEIYERCTLAEEIKRVSDALWVLRTEGKIEFAPGDGRKRYVMATGVSAQVPADKPEYMPLIDIPSLGVPVAPQADLGVSLNGAAGKTVRAKRVPADHPASGSKVIEAPATPAAKASPRCDQVASLLPTDAERLADVIISRLRPLLSQPMSAVIESLAAPAPMATIHIHIAQVDFHLGGL
jgi:hypothetical protein